MLRLLLDLRYITCVVLAFQFFFDFSSTNSLMEVGIVTWSIQHKLSRNEMKSDSLKGFFGMYNDEKLYGKEATMPKMWRIMFNQVAFVDQQRNLIFFLNNNNK